MQNQKNTQYDKTHGNWQEYYEERVRILVLMNFQTEYQILNIVCCFLIWIQVIKKYMDKNSLISEWTIWFTYQANSNNQAGYADQMLEVCTLKTWDDLAYLWKQSKIQDLSNFFIQQGGQITTYLIDDETRKINSINIFKKGIQPKWEHERNQKGGYFRFQVQKAQPDPEKIYQGTVFHFLGQNFEKSDLVNGVRFISSKNPNFARFRFEVWVSFNSQDHESCQYFAKMFGALFGQLDMQDKKIEFKNIQKKKPDQANKE